MTNTPRRPRRLVGVALTLAYAFTGATLLATMAKAGESLSSPDAGYSTPSPEQVPTPRESIPTVEPQLEPEVLGVSLPAATPTVVPTPQPPAGPPPIPAPFEPPAGEVLADAKRVGAAAVHALTNYDVGSSLDELVVGLTGDPARADVLAQVAGVVHHPDRWSRGTVEYAQMGGHTSSKASIMVVVRQDLGTDDAFERTETRTMDVRLARDAAGVWVFEELASAGGAPVARPADLSAMAAAVVDDPRIDLPDSAIWDIYSGDTDEALLRVLRDLADRTPFSAVVLHTGHPYYVFETDRVSNHSIGRAIDVYELDGVRVVDSRDDTSTIHSMVEWLASRTDIKELGSPWKINGAATHTFTNEVHQDHVHIGVFPLR